MTEHVEEKFTGSAGGSVYWQGWLSAEALGVVVISHGIAEHGGRYAHVAEHLAAQGFATYVADHQGHGRSAGARGNIERMDVVTGDLHTMIRLAGERHDGLPVFLLGHSMGGLIALQYVTGEPAALRGLIVSGPAVEIAVGSKFERAMAGTLSKLVPNLGVVKLDSSAVSRDPDVVHAYDTDPLNYRGRVRVRTGAEMLAAADTMAARLPKITMPVLILQGTEDKLVDPSSAKVVADGVGSDDVTVKTYDGLYHEVLNEPEKETVLADIVTWLKEHV
ncbi:alpha-beta hydrolase superfamily lysophospholipase [Herbihabitans rhizosphaerae]|uniref:Monoacylglycerol lipase n=1 Tax=Herbihabitans rhizosphaerae TaxID=1872711 RepID=A0A4V2EU59_9PSEU|nr:alpha/beta hydrolase [Herbihabitans rhizosphaerae]RZS43433.1 alpha-beta hydrolase superfamily lysophospholipase [Herbihabitans rhizosphaerae]